MFVLKSAIFFPYSLAHFSKACTLLSIMPSDRSEQTCYILPNEMTKQDKENVEKDPLVYFLTIIYSTQASAHRRHFILSQKAFPDTTNYYPSYLNTP